MPDRITKEFSEILESFRQNWPYCWTAILSLFAGIVQYIQKLKDGAKFSPWELICDLLVCLFVGYVTMLMCRIAGIAGDAQNLVVAISAHMGTRALMQYEAFRNRILGLQTFKRV